MKSALIITAHIEKIERININYLNYNIIILADNGYKYGKAMNLNPDFLIGDFDSMSSQDNVEIESSINSTNFQTKNMFSKLLKIINLPKEKDLTDTHAAVDLAINEGCNDITILGGLGGRFDHSIGNISLLNKYSSLKNIEIRILDGQNLIYILNPGSYKIEKLNFKYISFFSFGGPVINLSVNHVKYPIYKTTLVNDSTRFLSNEIIEDFCNIHFEEGKLLVSQCND